MSDDTLSNCLLQAIEPDNANTVEVAVGDILREILSRIEFTDIRYLGESNYEDLKVTDKHYRIAVVKIAWNTAKEAGYGFAIIGGNIYVFDKTYWRSISKSMMRWFLSSAAENIGVNMWIRECYKFQDELLKQFYTQDTQETDRLNENVLLNLYNGTLEISQSGSILRNFYDGDFITYKLGYRYDEGAEAPKFEAYLNRVVPEKDKQMVLAEYMGSIFLGNGTGKIKEEKVLMLLGSGENGKSVFFEVMQALIGHQNTGSFSLDDLLDEKGYSRDELGRVLVNYCTEFEKITNVSMFKAMVSGEPIAARTLYSPPYILRRYGKLIFNCNKVPMGIEHTHGFWRRFLIIPFEEKISAEEKDKELHLKIIKTELSGVLKWVLVGLQRLLKQKGFTYCESSEMALEKFRSQTDSVKMFLDEEGYKPLGKKVRGHYIKEVDLYDGYKSYCRESNFNAVNRSSFRQRLEQSSFFMAVLNVGRVVYCDKEAIKYADENEEESTGNTTVYRQTDIAY